MNDQIYWVTFPQLPWEGKGGREVSSEGRMDFLLSKEMSPGTEQQIL